MKSKDTKKRAPKVQGEGDYDAARRYRRDVEHFVRDNDPEDLAREAEPESREEAGELERAEAEGRARSRGGDAGPDVTTEPPDPEPRPGSR